MEGEVENVWVNDKTPNLIYLKGVVDPGSETFRGLFCIHLFRMCL